METTQFKDKQNRLIRLELTDGVVEAFDGNVLVGHFNWDEVSINHHKYKGDEYGALLTNIFLDQVPGYTGAGIGTEIVKMISDFTGYKVVVCQDHGTTRGDGAHPTGDAPGFYKSLVGKKLAYWYD